MKLLKLPHQLSPYRCPVNGLCDIYEWKTGMRIPETLIFDSRIGFKLESVKNGEPPEMVFFAEGGVGKDQYEFWAPKIGYEIISGDGASFKDTMKDIKALIDKDIPVILFGLDMFHLPYHESFYHKIHIPGHVDILVGYDDKVLYIHDNDRDGVQEISYGDMERAWSKGYMDFSKPNAYFGINMTNPSRDIGEILGKGFKQTGEAFLNSKAQNTGKKGYAMFRDVLPGWADKYDGKALKSICMHIATFTASTIPELPSELTPYPSGVVNPHRGGRDVFSDSLIRFAERFGGYNWKEAAAYFQESGKKLELLTNEIVRIVLEEKYALLPGLASIFTEIEEIETKAFIALLG